MFILKRDYLKTIKKIDSVMKKSECDLEFHDNLFGKDIYQMPNYRLLLTPQTFMLERVVVSNDKESETKFFHRFFVGMHKPSCMFFAVEERSSTLEPGDPKRFAFRINNQCVEIEKFLSEIQNKEENLEHFHQRLVDIANSDRFFYDLNPQYKRPDSKNPPTSKD